MSSSSATVSATSSASAAASSAAAGLNAGPNFKVVGIILAIVSGVLIGCSFVFKKKGLLRSQQGQVAGEGVAYLKSPLWWLGMIMMILGELCNFVAYAFVEAIVVTPLGALSVVISAIMSSIFLKEKLSFFGWMGCGLCILGSVIIALNGPQEESINQIKDFQKLFISPGFLSYIGVLILAAIAIIVYFGPRYGTKSMIWYIMVCSMIGGISVSVTTGLGSAIVTTLYYHDNQFNKTWFIYFLIIFVIVTLLTEVFYLNKALALFNTAMVTPTYYVIFTFFSMMTTIVLYRGLKAPASQIITLVMGFLVICFGITILQMSKVDPDELAESSKLDRRSTLLLHAARAHTIRSGPGSGRDGDFGDEKSIATIEEPGMDALRGSFGAFGSIIRARSAKRMSQASGSSGFRSGLAGDHSFRATGAGLPMHPRDTVGPNVERHQLFDPPVRVSSPHGSQHAERKQTIKFGEQDMVHEYSRSRGLDADADAVHTARPSAFISPRSPSTSSPSLQESVNSDSTTTPSGIVSSDNSQRATDGDSTSMTARDYFGSGSAASKDSAASSSRSAYPYPTAVADVYDGLPALEYDRGPRTAPVVGSTHGSGGTGYVDPYARAPGTATGATFPEPTPTPFSARRRSKESATAATAPFGPLRIGRDDPRRGSSGRSYPKSADRSVDAEESRRLVDEESVGSASETERDGSREDVELGGIRLVQRF